MEAIVVVAAAPVARVDSLVMQAEPAPRDTRLPEIADKFDSIPLMAGPPSLVWQRVGNDVVAEFRTKGCRT